MSQSDSTHRKIVAFSAESSIRYIPLSLEPRKNSKMSKQIFERFDGLELTNDMLEEATQLFDGNYGIWGKDPTSSRPTAKLGTRVKLTKDRLRAQYLPADSDCSYVRVTVEGRLAGNAFACRWCYKDKIVCWITQLVVHSDYRERGLAVGLVNQLRQDNDAIYGLMSSHPAACLAAAKALGSRSFPCYNRFGLDTNFLLDGITTVAVDFIRDNAEAIMKISPIHYVKTAKPRGSLFSPEDSSGMVSSVFTNFFVDHTEPLEALAWVREGLDWPLGELLEGHEFLLMIEVRRRDRSRSRPAARSQFQ